MFRVKLLSLSDETEREHQVGSYDSILSEDDLSCLNPPPNHLFLAFKVGAPVLSVRQHGDMKMWRTHQYDRDMGKWVVDLVDLRGTFIALMSDGSFKEILDLTTPGIASTVAEIDTAGFFEYGGVTFHILDVMTDDGLSVVKLGVRGCDIVQFDIWC